MDDRRSPPPGGIEVDPVRAESHYPIPVGLVGHPILMAAVERGAKHLLWTPIVIHWAVTHDPEDRGRLLASGGGPASARSIARAYRTAKVAAIDTCLSELLACGMLVTDDDGVCRFVDWTALFVSPLSPYMDGDEE